MRMEVISSVDVSKQVQNITRERSTNNTEIKKDNKNDNVIPTMDVEGQNKVDESKLIKAVESANKSFKTYDRKLEISIHERTKQLMVKVLDTSGDEDVVIREIPAKNALDRIADMWEMVGIIIDEKA